MSGILNFDDMDDVPKNPNFEDSDDEDDSVSKKPKFDDDLDKELNKTQEEQQNNPIPQMGEITLNKKNPSHLFKDDFEINEFKFDKKIINPNNSKHNIVYINNNNVLKYIEKNDEFINEINILYLLKSKCGDNCDKFINYINSYKNNYIMFENAGDTNLENFINSEKFKQISETDLTDICEQLVYIVKILHSIGIFHGDIKPSNILIQKTEKQYKLKLIDFGEASLLETTINEWSNDNYIGYKKNKNLYESTGTFNGLSPYSYNDKKIIDIEEGKKIKMGVELAIANKIIDQIKSKHAEINTMKKYYKYKLKYLRLKNKN